MAKELPYFKFEPAEWMMGRITRESSNVQISFLRLCCQYWRKTGKINEEDAELEAGEDEFQILLKKKFIKLEDGNIVIDFLEDQLNEMSNLSKTRKKAAENRWKKEPKNEINGNSMQLHKVAMQNDADKIRREEIRREEKTQIGASELSEEEEKLVKEVYNSFNANITELDMVHRKVCGLIRILSGKKQLEYFRQQLTYYHRYKDKAEEKKHSLLNYVDYWDQCDFKKKYQSVSKEQPTKLSFSL